MNTVYWASLVLAWAITVLGAVAGWRWRKPLKTATAEMQALLVTRREDAALAEWARHMNLTVVTVSGAVFSTTFAELQATDVPEFRSWNVPTQVTVWSDQAHPELTEDVRELVKGDVKEADR